MRDSMENQFFSHHAASAMFIKIINEYSYSAERWKSADKRLLIYCMGDSRVWRQMYAQAAQTIACKVANRQSPTLIQWLEEGKRNIVKLLDCLILFPSVLEKQYRFCTDKHYRHLVLVYPWKQLLNIKSFLLFMDKIFYKYFKIRENYDNFTNFIKLNFNFIKLKCF